MTEKPNNFNPFSNFNPFPFLDRDPQAVADQMAREMTRDEAALAIQRAETWLRDVREWEAARRYRIERDHLVTEQIEPSRREWEAGK